MEIVTRRNPKPASHRLHAVLACLLACMSMTMMAHARAEVLQGNLELRWGDARGASGKLAPPGRFRATLVTDDGVRHVLDPVQSRKAARARPAASAYVSSLDADRGVVPGF